jgi:hypothetical protein
MIRYERAIARLLVTGIAWSLVAAAQQQPESRLGENAALRYWSAFSQMQDSSISPEQAKELQAVLDGATPYSDAKFRDLVERNRLALETLQRGTALAQCDWGLEYELGSRAPIEYVRKALALGRLNVLYSLRQLAAGDRTGAVRTLATGIRFSHDVDANGPLIAGLAAKTLIVAHLRAVDFAAQQKALSAGEKALLSAGLGKIGPEGVDWQATIRREFEVLARSGSPAPAAVEELYQRSLQDAGQLQRLQKAIDAGPRSVATLIPRPQRVLEQKRELDEKLQKTRLMLQ